MYRFILILLVVSSCINLYDFKQDEAAAPLVVEGYVSNNPGDSEIKLSRSGKFQRNVFDQVSDAVVVVVENETVEHPFTHRDDGLYKPVQKDFRANMESSYRLKFKVDGQQYESDQVTMLSSLEIDHLTVKPADDLLENPNLELFITSNIDEDASRHYIYSFEETWKVVAMHANDKIMRPVFIYNENNSPIDVDFEIIFEGNTTHCWANNKVERIKTLSTNGLSRNQLLNLPLFTVSLETTRLIHKYSVLVNQYAITKEVHHFFNLLTEFSESSGLLYDTQPGYIEGNIHNTSEPGDKVIGIFYAASHTSARIFLTNDELSYPVKVIIANNAPRCDFISFPGIDPFLLTDPPNIRYTLGLLHLRDTLIEKQNLYVVECYRNYNPDGTEVEFYLGNLPCADCRLSGTNIKPEWWE